MANLKSAQKKARKDVVRRKVNLARMSAIKTAIKKLYTALEEGTDAEAANVLFNEAQAKLARARGKGLLHRNTVQRKLSRLAKKVTISTATSAK
jgi:small subunit ribosomal protein S20